MPDRVCPFNRCDGSGWIIGEETDSHCACGLVLEVKSRIKDLWGEAKVLDTPLYKPGPKSLDEPPIVDLTKKNLVITGRETDILAHLKRALYCKLFDTACNWRYFQTSDARLLSVWLGKEAYDSRPKNKRENVVSHNALRDIVGPEYDLAIITVGLVIHPNVAAAGVLKEALLLREAEGKPTWIVHRSELSWIQSYSLDLEEYLDRLYDVVDIPVRPDSVDEEPRPVVEDIDPNDPSESPERQAIRDHMRVQSRPKPKPVETPAEDEAEDDSPSPISKGKQKKSGWGKGWKNHKKQSGGGPTGQGF